jgi:hemerythrin superfamily protein
MSTTGQSAAPTHDVVGILLRQHERIRELFGHVREAQGEHRRHAFDELRALLAAHETAEEMVVRPFTSTDGGSKDVADAHNAEESEASRVLADLEKLDPDSAEFDSAFVTFEHAVLNHARHEETREFPIIRGKASREQREGMGLALIAAERIAPTHPHPGTAGKPAAQWTVGPFASLLDRARDAVRGAMR